MNGRTNDHPVIADLLKQGYPKTIRADDPIVGYRWIDANDTGSIVACCPGQISEYPGLQFPTNPVNTLTHTSKTPQRSPNFDDFVAGQSPGSLQQLPHFADGLLRRLDAGRRAK